MTTDRLESLVAEWRRRAVLGYGKRDRLDPAEREQVTECADELEAALRAVSGSVGGEAAFAYMPYHIADSVNTNIRNKAGAVFTAYTEQHDPRDVPLYTRPTAAPQVDGHHLTAIRALVSPLQFETICDVFREQGVLAAPSPAQSEPPAEGGE